MILGTILLSKSIYTNRGRQYEVRWDINPEAKSASGLVGCALCRKPDGEYKQGDRVQLAYIVAGASGLWYILGRVE